MGAQTSSALDRLASKLSKYARPAENGCIEWLAGKNANGYGVVHLWPKSYLAHRISWMVVRGAIAEGLCVLHGCDNPACINADHLFLGTHQDNMDDMWAKGRARPGHDCRKGKRNHMARLSEEQVRQIRIASGSQRKIGRRFGISQRAVSDIKTGRRWGHLWAQ